MDRKVDHLSSFLSPASCSGRRLGAEKCRDICGTGAEAVATANPGCHLQIQNHLDESGEAVEVTQPVLLLAEAYRLEF
ncbi:MAG: heterodisulfide reductase-related iron-sulfur binding cluster [Akkermansiaceae bacterium]